MSDVVKKPDDSDNESLPDLSDFIAAPPATGILKGDVVWAKFKNLYWPALVRSVYSREKKISVWYTDEPGKTFKIPIKNVRPFHDKEMRIKIAKDVKEAGCVQEHDGLTSHAIRYLKRKAAGYTDDPMKFFDQTYPFYLVEEFLQKNPDADVSSIKIPPLYIAHEKKSMRKSVNVQMGTSSTVESDIESVSSDSESNAENVPKDLLSKVSIEFSSTSTEDENIDKVIDFVKSGKADDYLGKILSKRIPSNHRDVYERQMKCNKKRTFSLTYTGPIEDDKKLRELIFYLLSLHNRVTSNQRSKRYPTRKSKSKLIDYPSFDKKSENAQFVASVWLPEAIIYAMSNVYNVSLADAKQLFHKKSEYELKDIETIFASLTSEATTSHSEGVEQKLTLQNDNKIGISSPLKKICVRRFNKNSN